MNKVLNGDIYCHQLNGWLVSWESDAEYRHWCYQSLPNQDHEILVVMINPGSLSGNGKNLSKDVTLRILREVFTETNANPFVVNLFDYATPSPNELFKNWELRDNHQLIFSKIKNRKFAGVLYAYGDYENRKDYGHEVKERISLVKNHFQELNEIILPKNNSGTPKHPLVWQRQMIKDEIHRNIVEYMSKA